MADLMADAEPLAGFRAVGVDTHDDAPRTIRHQLCVRTMYRWLVATLNSEHAGDGMDVDGYSRLPELGAEKGDQLVGLGSDRFAGVRPADFFQKLGDLGLNTTHDFFLRVVLRRVR